jgi:hypothetical protein
MQTIELIRNEMLSESDTVELREIFVSQYCNNKGWDRYNLSFEQVLEIRAHNEWKSPGIMKS